ncbi:hypothetical protein F4780DRAFT_733781 [Xylariomycetidae sp. FL0641]|nr:hypothetical protein F4780DRAFT_733781 [Xylariomycetidae sp. FL0641]
MPISDLLAQISGGQPSPPPPSKPPASSGVKRKAEDDTNGATTTKLTKARQPDGSYSSSKVTRDAQGNVVERSYSVSRPVKSAHSSSSAPKPSALPHRTNSSSTNGRYEPPVPNSQRNATSIGKPVSVPASKLAKQSSDSAARPKLNSSALASSKAPPSKPSPTTPTASDAPRAPPKKGSFAEILARGAKAQQMMGKVGMIQHKPLEKAAMAKKEREVVKPEQKGPVKGKVGKPYQGNGKPSSAMSRDAVRPATSARDTPRNGVSKDAKAGPKQKEVAPEKKVKKSAVATTGYTGTARPRPGATSDKSASSRGRPGSRPAAGGPLAPPRPGRRDRYEEEYDEDMDDFIDYDDEEEEPGYGGRYGGYDSEGSSDMEAGLSDIDVEERKAERLAKEEDKREQALEEKLKREKEERRRRLAQGGR